MRAHMDEYETNKINTYLNVMLDMYSAFNLGILEVVGGLQANNKILNKKYEILIWNNWYKIEKNLTIF